MLLFLWRFCPFTFCAQFWDAGTSWLYISMRMLEFRASSQSQDYPATSFQRGTGDTFAASASKILDVRHQLLIPTNSSSFFALQAPSAAISLGGHISNPPNKTIGGLPARGTSQTHLARQLVSVLSPSEAASWKWRHESDAGA